MGTAGGRIDDTRAGSPWSALLVLMAVAAALRALQWSRAVTLFNDGPLFLSMAKAAAAGDWSALLASPHHPLYSLAVAAVHATGLDWETAAATVSVTGGAAAVALLFLFVRDAFGVPAAWIAAGLLAVHSRAVEYSSDVQSDGLYLALFLAAVLAAWRAWTRASVRHAAAAGLAAGLAYLTRPEGIGIAVVAIGLALVSVLRRHWSPSAALRWSASLAAAAAIGVLPYSLALAAHTGHWTLTQKKSVEQLAGVASPTTAGAPAPGLPARISPIAAQAAAVAHERADLDRGEDGLAVERAPRGPERAWAAARMLARTSKSAFRYGLLLLLVPGLYAARGRPSRRGVFVAAIAGAYAIVLFALTYQMGYVSRRHALPPLVPLFGYAGIGAFALAGGLIRLARRRTSALPAVAAGIAAAIGVAELYTQREPRRSEERAARSAAEWLRDHAEPGPVAARKLRLGYYAGMPYVPLVPAVDASFTARLDAAGVRYVLADEAEQADAIRRTAGASLRPIHQVKEGSREAWVFERVGLPVAAAQGAPADTSVSAGPEDAAPPH